MQLTFNIQSAQQKHKEEQISNVMMLSNYADTDRNDLLLCEAYVLDSMNRKIRTRFKEYHLNCIKFIDAKNETYILPETIKFMVALNNGTEKIYKERALFELWQKKDLMLNTSCFIKDRYFRDLSIKLLARFENYRVIWSEKKFDFFEGNLIISPF